MTERNVALLCLRGDYQNSAGGNTAGRCWAAAGPGRARAGGSHAGARAWVSRDPPLLPLVGTKVDATGSWVTGKHTLITTRVQGT